MNLLGRVTRATSEPGRSRGRLSVRGLLAQVMAVSVLGLTSVVALAVPASAHDTLANYRTRLTAVTPAVPGLRVTASPDGSFIRVRNTSASPVVVEGYEHEPYLKVSSQGVWQNTLSPATYLNQELTIGEVPANADAKATPVWKKISAKPVAQFHDHRIHWMGNGRPAVVDKDPASPHLIKRWTVPMSVGTTAIAVQGTLRWQPGNPLFRYLGYGFVLVGLGGAVLVGVALWRRQRRLTRVEPSERTAVPEHV
ncbi:MAG: hypothetical protein QOI54_3102 [Actinomycetota bacterium]|jgi:hypothetical protein|nr:hypothetical protein [Actinomycetota bacterium]